VQSRKTERDLKRREREREGGGGFLLLLMILTMSVHSSTCFMAAVFVHIGTPPANTYAGLYDIRERPTGLLLIVGVVLLGVLITMVLVAVTQRRITGNIEPYMVLCLPILNHRRRKILKVGGAKDMIARARKISDHAHFRSNRAHF